MADKPRLTPEELAIWRQTIIEDEDRTGKRVLDAVIEDLKAIAGQGKSPALVAQLAAEAKVSPRTVRYKLKAWQAKGFLHKAQVGGTPGTGRQQGNAIEPALPEGKTEREMEQDRHSYEPPVRAGPRRKSRGFNSLRLTAVG